MARRLRNCTFLEEICGRGTLMVKVSDRAWHVTSSNPIPLKNHRLEKRCTLNLSTAQTSSYWCGGLVRRGVPAQVSSSSLHYGSKLRGPSSKALVQLNTVRS
ncbi:uncharacterized protein TNCV_1924851 [Trichonephila clavipes]|nr:uncharacterized protein TNCV_1924851 [Trichonephila clavipes]